MPVSEEFLGFLLDQLSAWGGVGVRKMFGGAGLYRDGKMFALVADDVAYLKVDDSNRHLFEETGATQFKPYADKPMRMPYFEIPPSVLEQPETLIEWATRSLAIPARGRSGR